MKLCKLCYQPIAQPYLDFGEQALSNRFLRSPHEPQYLHPLAIGICGSCGLVQLEALVPPDELRPRFAWLAYNEPEGHLDDLVEQIVALPGIRASSNLCGLSYKDDSTLARLRQRGFGQTWRADPDLDLGIDDPCAGIESIQCCLQSETAERLVERHGRPDVVIIRHVLEHAHDLHEMIGALRSLVAPAGYVVFEMPDATRALERCDYSTVWEEHSFYFTPATLRQCLAIMGFDIVFERSYYYSLENSLVAIARRAPACGPAETPADSSAELARFQGFCQNYPLIRAAYQARLEQVTRTEGKAALLGAGHLSAAFINLLGVEDFIELVADDNPHKQGLYMPGSRVPILGSSELVNRDISLCLMTVRPEIEAAVVKKNQAFQSQGGRLASIFPDSPHSFQAACGKKGDCPPAFEGTVPFLPA